MPGFYDERDPDGEDKAHDEHVQRQVDEEWFAELLLRQQQQQTKESQQ